MEERISIIEKADRSERVVICRRKDGNFTYRRQWADPAVLTGPDYGWGPPGPDLGVYDTPATAEMEAMQRVAWLKTNFH